MLRLGLHKTDTAEYTDIDDITEIHMEPIGIAFKGDKTYGYISVRFNGYVYNNVSYDYILIDGGD